MRGPSPVTTLNYMEKTFDHLRKEYYNWRNRKYLPSKEKRTERRNLIFKKIKHPFQIFHYFP